MKTLYKIKWIFYASITIKLKKMWESFYDSYGSNNKPNPIAFENETSWKTDPILLISKYRKGGPKILTFRFSCL